MAGKAGARQNGLRKKGLSETVGRQWPRLQNLNLKQKGKNKMQTKKKPQNAEMFSMCIEALFNQVDDALLIYMNLYRDALEKGMDLDQVENELDKATKMLKKYRQRIIDFDREKNK